MPVRPYYDSVTSKYAWCSGALVSDAAAATLYPPYALNPRDPVGEIREDSSRRLREAFTLPRIQSGTYVLVIW